MNGRTDSEGVIWESFKLQKVVHCLVVNLHRGTPSFVGRAWESLLFFLRYQTPFVLEIGVGLYPNLEFIR